MPGGAATPIGTPGATPIPAGLPGGLPPLGTPADVNQALASPNTPTSGPSSAAVAAVPSPPVKSTPRPASAQPQSQSTLPYVKRAVRSLGRHKLLATATILLSFLISLFPFVVSASFGPLLQIMGSVADSGGWSQIWSETGSLYSKSEAGGLSGFEAWLATPLSFGTLFVIWAGSLVFSHLLSFINLFVKAQLDRRLITETRQQVYDHMQSLSLDFFTGEQAGALMQRVLMETLCVQRLVTGVAAHADPPDHRAGAGALLPDGLSWQMTIVSFILRRSPTWPSATRRQAGAGHQPDGR